MPIYRYKNASVFHVHVPKTGGTAITDACKNFGCDIEIFSKQPDPKFNITPQHYHYDIWKHIITDSMIKIVGWRNPWHRTVSEFVWQTHGDKFENLNIWLNDCLVKYQENPTWGDNHFRPQTEFFILDDYTHVMPYEKTMQTAKKLIKNFLDLNIDFVTKPQKRIDYTFPDIDDVLEKNTKHTWEQIYIKDMEFEDQ